MYGGDCVYSQLVLQQQHRDGIVVFVLGLLRGGYVNKLTTGILQFIDTKYTCITVARTDWLWMECRQTWGSFALHVTL